MRLLFVVILLSSLGSLLYAQSDYEIVQNFKSMYDEYMQDIEDASAVGELEEVKAQIEALRDEFRNYKDLLDKSLYPENFTSSFEKINSALVLRMKEIMNVEELSEEVESLKTEITDLSNKNRELIDEIKVLNNQLDKSESEVASLRKLNAELKHNLKQRDILVRSIIDTLLTGFMRAPTTLDEAEKINMIGEIENRSLFYNIERVIADNIDYLEVTEMTLDDFNEMLEQHEQFKKSWTQLGPKLADVYLKRRDRSKEIAYIEGLFDSWGEQITTEVWKEINKLFKARDINLLSFENGDQLKESMMAFIDSEIENYGLKEETESEKIFEVFTDGVYYKEVQPKWIPFLIDRGMFDRLHKVAVEERIAKWKEIVYPAPSLTWLWIIIGLLVIAQFGFYIKRKQNKI